MIGAAEFLQDLGMLALPDPRLLLGRHEAGEGRLARRAIGRATAERAEKRQADGDERRAR